EDGNLAARVALLHERRDLHGDEAGLGVLVLDLDHLDGLALAELRPEVLLLALAVVPDDPVRGLEDRVRGAVVLLERDRPRLPALARELEDVADVGASERVDRLVRVADGADVLRLAREQLEQP